ncbi:N-acetyltransferase [Paenibacillus sp. VCA1]|uniref:N-acetyltransferase n=1 Tax=Paenibacillus sp. VCA1 TaxID=3039148 RepID=UPI002871DF0C|nr:N-acetyltransferase [Paenibacillus sp. VCA1]MDR9854199.1 N-acetyltransferase [Paenibacillus sp. VCA1]
MHTWPVTHEALAKRIQRAEIGFTTSRIRSIGEQPGNPQGVEIQTFGSAVSFYVKTMPWGLFNSVKGLSGDDAGRVEDIIRFYKERNRAFLLDIDPVDTDPKLFRHLAENGLFQQGFHSVLYGMPDPQKPELPSGITIRQVDNEADFDAYAGIHCVGSGMDIAHKHHFAENNIGLLNRPGWTLYLAYWQDQPAAVGVMHVSDGIASFTLAATHPEFRNKGLQSSLLKWRMHEAYQAGCELVAAQAAFGSTSQNNMERAGMRLAWTRAVWAPLSGS